MVFEVAAGGREEVSGLVSGFTSGLGSGFVSGFVEFSDVVEMSCRGPWLWVTDWEVEVGWEGLEEVGLEEVG